MIPRPAGVPAGHFHNGNGTVGVMKMGWYTGNRMKRTILTFLAAAVVGTPSVAAQQAAATARIVGRVIDQESHRPISGAAIIIDGQGRAVTDEAGWFTLNAVAAGEQQLRVDMIGYGSRTESVNLRTGVTHELEITLAREAIELAPIDVSIRSEFLEARGFYERERDGGGTHISRSDIERRRSRTLTDILREVPSVRLYDIEPGRRHVRLNRGAAVDVPAFDPREKFVFAGCEPDLYIDGQLFRERIPRDATEQKVTSWDVVATEQIEGIEVYAGANAPTQYQNPCGVVLVWTRRAPSAAMTRVTTTTLPAPPSLTVGSMARLTSRYDGKSSVGTVHSINRDSIALIDNQTPRSFALNDLRRLEIDRGIASVPERSWRGAKWGFMVSALLIAVTAAGEEFSRTNDKNASVASTSPRNPQFALTIIGSATVTGAFLGGTVWRYRKWQEVPIR
jgi:hypothetical protein